jgi:hypothetical protein
MPDLAGFQDAFSAALAGAEDRLDPWGGPGPGLAVYRNTVARGCIDALAANFPTVERLVGPEWFRAAAREFTEEVPPAEPALLAYGEAFPDWLALFPPARSMPYLAAVARLDRFWMEAHLAEDARPLDPAALAGLDAEALERTAARLHPGARLAWFDDNSPTLWLANRYGEAEQFDFAEAPEGMLITRPGPTVEARVLDRAAFAFIAACRDGRTLAEAAAAALAEPQADLPAIFAACLEDGLFVALEPGGGAP